MTRVADIDNESYLLNIALHGTASHVEDVVRGYRRALDAVELTREAMQQRDQSLWWHTEPDGSLVIRGRLPADVGALFVRALQAAQDTLPIPTAKDVSAETFSDREDLQRARKRRVEALAVLAESSWRRDRKTSQGPTGTRSWCTWMRRPSGRPSAGPRRPGAGPDPR